MSHSSKKTARRRAAAQKMGLQRPVPRLWRALTSGATGFFLIGYAGALGLSSLRFLSPTGIDTAFLGAPAVAAALFFALGAWNFEPNQTEKGDSDLALLPNLLIWTGATLLFGLIALALFSNLIFTSLNALAPGWKQSPWTIAIPIVQTVAVVIFEGIGAYFALRRIEMKRSEGQKAS